MYMSDDKNEKDTIVNTCGEINAALQMCVRAYWGKVAFSQFLLKHHLCQRIGAIKLTLSLPQIGRLFYVNISAFFFSVHKF